MVRIQPGNSTATPYLVAGLVRNGTAAYALHEDVDIVGTLTLAVLLLQSLKWRNEQTSSFETAWNRTGVMLKESSKFLRTWGSWGLTAGTPLCFIDIET